MVPVIKLVRKFVILNVAIIAAFFIVIMSLWVIYIITNTAIGLYLGHTSPAHYLIPFYELSGLFSIDLRNIPHLIAETASYFFKPNYFYFTIPWILMAFIIYRFIDKNIFMRSSKN